MLKQLHCELHCVMGSDPISNPARGGGVGVGVLPLGGSWWASVPLPPPSCQRRSRLGAYTVWCCCTRHCLGAVVHDSGGEGVAVVVVVDAVRVYVCVCVSKLCSLPHRCLAGSLLIGPELH